jgi:hypothetical protein
MFPEFYLLLLFVESKSHAILKAIALLEKVNCVRLQRNQLIYQFCEN